MPKRCPSCGSFLANVIKEVWARKHDGSKIMIKLSGERCSCCHYRKTESYFLAIKRLGLAPWGNRPPGEAPTHYDPEQQADIDRCYRSVKKGGHVCAGCLNDAYCQMPRDTYRWMADHIFPLLSGHTRRGRKRG